MPKLRAFLVMVIKAPTSPGGAWRRLANMKALTLQAGEIVADIGAGTGLLTLDLARAVGETGSVIAIDPSSEMRAAAMARCADRANVRIIEGKAAALPLENDCIDSAVSLQVFEYLDNIPAALAEVQRVLRPGGRLVIGDLHWDSHVWYADNGARMTRMLRHWDRHLVERCVPAILPPLLREAGFAVESVQPELCQDTVFRADGLARLMTHLIRAYVGQNALTDPEEVEDWISEQHQLAKGARFFFAITHYVVSARKL